MNPSARRLSNLSRNGQNFELGGIWEQIFATHVLPFLLASDLCVLSNTCHFFCYTSQISHLWITLIEEDFSLPNQSSEISRTSCRNNDSIRNSTTLRLVGDDSEDHTGNCDTNAIHYLPSSKNRYAQRLNEKSNRYRLARERAVRTKMGCERDRKQRCIKSFLDLTLFRILIPLPLTSMFLSIILFTLHYDGMAIPIWGCAAPLLFYFIYLLIFSLISSIVYKQRSDATNILYHLWGNVQGPIKAFYVLNLHGSPMLVICAIIVIFMCLIQIIFIAIKLSPLGTIGNVVSTINWGIVFLPLWILFLICPILGCLREPAILLLGILLIWVPLLIVLICITVKLNRQQILGSGPDIRMAYIFIPFWIVEGSVMICALLFFFFGLYSIRLGLTTRLQEHISAFVATWMLLGPFVIFQILICVQDDRKLHNLSHTDTVVPLLIIIGWFFICAVVFALRSRTPFQELHSQNERETAGASVIFNV